ncbi:ABC transporter permease [Mucilaginibacter gynuensis]|uniref:ABC transporter permease n=2 Tax=Mucilaginibacter gynuensis TaxID=1302236 RepID=A0ABP8G5L2_9SPHI
MAAVVLIFIWVQNELSFDKNIPDNANIYRIKNYISVDKTTTWVWEHAPFNMGEAMKNQIPGIETAGRVLPLSNVKVYLNIDGQYFDETRTAFIDSGWLDMYKYDFVRGSAGAFNSNVFGMILTESKAKKYFGTIEAIGKTIKIDTNIYAVQGIIKDIPANSSFNFDVLRSIAGRQTDAHEKKNDLSWGNFSYLTFFKAQPGTNVKNAMAKLQKIVAKARDNDNTKISYIPLTDLHFENDLQSSSLVQGDKKVVTIFGILGLLVLIIACINYVNITTARASLRAKEVSVRKIVGASRWSLFMQFVTETAFVSLLALIFTLIIVQLALPAFNNFTEKHFTLSLNNIWLWIVLLGTLFITILLNSIYPALLLSSFKPLNSFRGMSVLRMNDALLRRGLVVLQFTFSVFLIVGVITIYKQMEFIRNQNPGYNRSQVFSFTMPWQMFRKVSSEQRTGAMQNVKQQIAGQSFVENVSLVNGASVQNFDNQSSGGFDWDGRQKDFDPPFAVFQVDADFNKIVKLKFVEGRWFLPNSKGDGKNIVLNEAAAKAINLHKPYVGQRFVAQGDTGVVVGIVKDFAYRSMHEKIGPAVFKISSDYMLTSLVKVAPGKNAQAIAAAGKLWDSYNTGRPFSYQFLDDEFDRIYKNDIKASGLISAFAIIAVIISCLGLFGLAAFTAEQRGKEIGIRKVLGASVSGIVSLLSKDFIILVVLALVVATPLAWWLMSKWLQNFAYRIHMEWWMFVAGGLLALIIAFVTVSFQAFKAAMINPVKSLRSE